MACRALVATACRPAPVGPVSHLGATGGLEVVLKGLERDNIRFTADFG